MVDTKNLTPEAHKKQIDAYEGQLPGYKTYTDSLRRVLPAACKAAFR